MSHKQVLAEVQKTMNKLFELPTFQNLLPRMPNFRYFQIKKDNYAFCWTTEKTKDKKFYALIYRILKDDTWSLKRKIAFGKRKVAKARALKWYNQRKKEITLEDGNK